MRTALPFLMFGLLLAPLAWAEAKVGPMDGAEGPSLPAMAMPTLVAEAELFNPTLPLSLENLGMDAAATLEWARLLPEARGAERAMVLERLAILSFKQNERNAAAHWLQLRATEFPRLSLPASVLVAQLQGATPTERDATLMTLTTVAPEDAESLHARYADVWRQAVQRGRVGNSWGVPQAALLTQRLEPLRAAAMQRWQVAVGLSVIPGAGHAFLGAWGIAAMLLLGWCVLGWAFAAACRNRHYAYALVFALPWVGVWMNAPMAVGALADQQAKTTRVAAMQGWSDLHTVAPSDK